MYINVYLTIMKSINNYEVNYYLNNILHDTKVCII